MSSPAETPTATGVVDLDFHPFVDDREALLGRMPAAWSARLHQNNFVLPQAKLEDARLGGEAALAAAADPALAASQWLDPHGISTALLVSTQGLAVAGWLDTGMCSEYCRALNDELIENWLAADKRFRLALAVSPHDPVAAAAEVRRVGSTPGVEAVALPLIDVNLGQPHYHPIYEAALEHGLAIVVHPTGNEGITIGAPTLGGAPYRSTSERFALLPQVAGANLASIIFDGVLERHPELKVVFSGFGYEWLPSALWRFEKEWVALRIDVPWVERSPLEQVAAQIRIAVGALQPAERSTHAAQVAAMLPPEALVYGSDFPYYAAAPADAIESNVGTELAGAVAADNAAVIV